MASDYQELISRLNHSLQIVGKTHAENAKAAALDLMDRAASLQHAIQALKLPYTFEIMKVSPEKRKARQTLANAVVEMLESLRDEILEAALMEMLYARDLTTTQIDVILGVHNERAVKDSSVTSNTGT